MRNQLSGRFTLGGLCGFAWPTIVMSVFMSLYTMIDGAFVARLVGTDALSAVNIVFPLVNLYIAVGIMLATGSAAIVARQLGERKTAEARENFTAMTMAAVVAGLAVTVACLIFLDPLLRFLGAGDALFAYCRDYAVPLLFFVPLAMLQMMFQSYFVVAGRPGLGMAAVIAGGVANIVLDYLFIAVYGMGLAGAAIATGIGYAIPAVIGVLHFARQGAVLAWARPRWRWLVCVHSCLNGSSEMVTNLSMAVVTYLFNLVMLRYLGVDGVAAVTIVLYAGYLLCSAFFGYSAGVSPVISYQYGQGRTVQLKRLFRNSLFIVGASSLAVLAASWLFAGDIIAVFAAEGGEVYDLAHRGFRLFSLSFVFMGFNIFASTLFTALSNGRVSAILSFCRTFVFLVVALFALPRMFGENGIWLAVPLAEFAAVFVSAAYIGKMRTVYQYA